MVAANNWRQVNHIIDTLRSTWWHIIHETDASSSLQLVITLRGKLELANEGIWCRGRMSTWKHANTHIALGGWVARCRIGRKGIAVASQVLQRCLSQACRLYPLLLCSSHYLPLFHPSSARKENNFLCLKWGSKKRHWKDVLAGHAPAVLTSAVMACGQSNKMCSSSWIVCQSHLSQITSS